jgi:ApaG protein
MVLNHCMFHAMTHMITVNVLPEYISTESWPAAGRFVFAYHIEIHNGAQEKVQLLRRYWRIIDSFNRVYEVEGEGVLGLQPHIKAGESHAYSSGCPLTTPTGKMSGHFLMNGAGRGLFIAQIPEFSLISPYEIRE